MKKAFFCATLWFAICSFSFAQHYQVLYNFAGVQPGNGDGAEPFAGLIRDQAGNLFGTTFYGGFSGYPCNFGGVFGCGTVFELAPNNEGGWSEAVIYSFCQSGETSCPEGSPPEDSLAMDAAGNLYGTTHSGGSGGPDGGVGGVVFKLSPPSQQGGAWTETVRYNFCSDYSNTICLDGGFPVGGVVLDNSGNIYGTTSLGGTENAGIVFELSPGSSGWTKTTIHSFCSDYRNGLCLDGIAPLGGLVFDKSGNLYGTTSQGGTSPQTLGSGVLFKLSPRAKGWAETVLANFGEPQGTSPDTAVSLDNAGNLYGPLSRNGPYKNGGLFQWNRANGQIREIDFKGPDGAGPDGAVLVDALGRGFYGTTEYGAKNAGHGPAGVIYHVSPSGKKTTIYEFCSQFNCTDGMNPIGNLVEDPQGNIYGTTIQGGAYGLGVVFELTP